VRCQRPSRVSRDAAFATKWLASGEPLTSTGLTSPKFADARRKGMRTKVRWCSRCVYPTEMGHAAKMRAAKVGSAEMQATAAKVHSAAAEMRATATKVHSTAAEMCATATAEMAPAATTGAGVSRGRQGY
jgi:hypothetical protein